jgi:predicted dehydrogenase
VALALIVVGVGKRGRHWVELARSRGHRVVAVVDPSDEALAAVAVNGTRGHRDLDEALATTGADAVIVASPPADHHAAVRRALAHGHAVLAEKPLATSLAEARELVAAAGDAGRPLLVGQNYRYMRHTRATGGLLAAGRLGVLRSVHTHVYRAPEQLPVGLRHLDDNVLWNQGVHPIDQLIHLLGPVAEVSADCFIAADGALERGTSVHALLRFASGVHGTLEVTYESSGHQFFESGQRHMQRFTGSDATLHVLQRWLVLCPNGGWPRLARRGPGRGTDDVAVLAQLEDAVQTGREQDLDACGNLATVATMEACVRSSREGRWVAVDG